MKQRWISITGWSAVGPLLFMAYSLLAEQDHQLSDAQRAVYWRAKAQACYIDQAAQNGRNDVICVEQLLRTACGGEFQFDRSGEPECLKPAKTKDLTTP